MINAMNSKALTARSPRKPIWEREAEQAAVEAKPMHVVVYSPSSDEVIMSRELEGHEMMVERHFADEVAKMYDTEIDESDGHIPNCSGDIRVEFRFDPNDGVVIWSGQSFYFVR